VLFATGKEQSITSLLEEEKEIKFIMSNKHRVLRKASVPYNASLSSEFRLAKLL
jgi:hypothetical protein